jgi:O-antigen/teichoic acid export membrane protein
VIVVGTIVGGVGLLIQVTADVLSISLQARLQLGRLAVVDLSRRVVALILVVTLALLGASLLPFVAASAAAAAFALALLGWMVRASIRPRLSVDLRAWRALFRETLGYALAMSVGAIYFYVTVIMMSLIASATQTGLFGTSFRVTQVALGIPILLLTAIFPLMSQAQRGDQGGADDVVGKVFRVAVISGVWMSLVISLVAGLLINVIAGRQGHGAVSVLQIQGIVLTMSFVSASSALGLMSRRRYGPLIIASSCALVLDIALGLILIPRLGAEGGALADVITEAGVAIGLTAALIHVAPTHGIRASIAPAVLLGSALAATVWLLPIGSVARAVAATILYFAVLLMTGTVPDELIRAAPWTKMFRTRV